MKKWLFAVIAGAVVLSGIFSVLSWRRSAGDSRKVRNEVAGQVDDLSRRLTELEARPSADRVVIVQQPVHRTAESDVAQAESGVLDPADEATIMAEKQLAAAAGLEARFRREPPDPTFTRDASLAVRGGLEAGTHSRVASVECVRSMCKVVATHDTPEEQTLIGTQIETVPFFHSGTYLSYERDVVPLKTTLYVVRPGHSFRE